MPMELPTRNVAGSPTSVSSPDELLMMAVATASASCSCSLRSWRRSGVRQERTERRHERNEQEQEALAVAPCRAQVDRPHAVEDPGPGQGARHHHAAEQQRKWAASGPQGRQDILLA